MDKRAVAAALMSCCAIIACGCSVKKNSHKEKKDDRPTTWAVEQRSIEDVTPLKGEEDAFVTRDENDTVRLIQGVLGNVAVRDEKAALDFISSFSQCLIAISLYNKLFS